MEHLKNCVWFALSLAYTTDIATCTNFQPSIQNVIDSALNAPILPQPMPGIDSSLSIKLCFLIYKVQSFDWSTDLSLNWCLIY